MTKEIKMKEPRTGAPVDLVVKNGKVVTPGYTKTQWIAVDGGRIVAMGDIESMMPQARQTIDASGKYVLPGVVDNEHHPCPPKTGSFHTDEPVAEVVTTDSKASLIGGVTTHGIQMSTPWLDPYLHDYPDLRFNRERIPSLMEAFPKFKKMMARSYTDYFLTPFVTTDEQVREIPEFAEKYGVTSYKMYLQMLQGEHIRSMWPLVETMGWYHIDDGTIYLAMKNIAELGPPGLLGFHAENWEIACIIKEELMAEGRSDVAAWDEKTPPFAEAGHVRNYAYYAKATGCPIYIQHTTTPETVEEIVKAKAEGVNIFGNSSPHYLTLTSDLDRAWRTNCPLRSREAVDKCWEALRDGVIETISSDNCTTDVRALKEVEKYGLKYHHNALTWWDGGMGGRSEAFLPVMLSEGVNKGRVSLERLVEVCCENPARYFGIYPKKGIIAIGSDADFAIVDLDETKILTRDMLHAWIPWSIWEGWEIKGWPVMIIIRGKLMMEWPKGAPKAKIVGKPNGQYMPRKPGHALYPLD